jgi:glycosyltransferase involved in cell wall biosynthesis
VVPDGLPDGAFVSAAPVPPPPFRLVHVGGFDGRKGQDTAVEVLARLVERGLDARLTFLGDGERREEIVRLAAARGVAERCELAGLVEDVPARLAASHLLLMTSSSEGGSLAVVEALAAGCPVACHDIEGAGEILREARAGRLIVGLDPEVWADAVVEVLTVPEPVRRSIVQAGREFAATRTIARTAQIVRRELEDAVRRARPA